MKWQCHSLPNYYVGLPMCSHLELLPVYSRFGAAGCVFIVWSKLAVYMLLMMLYYKLTVDMLLIMSKCAQYTDHVVLQVDNILVTDISKKMQLAKKNAGHQNSITV